MVPLRLVDGARSVPAFTAAADVIATDAAQAAGMTDFPPLQIDSPRAKTDDLIHSSRVLVGGLLAAVLIATLAVGAALAQAWARHHGQGVAKQAVEKANQYAYRDRKRRKRTFRALWIQRLNAAVRPFGLTYSRFIDGLGKAGLLVDRKVLSDLAIREPAAFAAIVEKAKGAIAA